MSSKHGSIFNEENPISEAFEGPNSSLKKTFEGAVAINLNEIAIRKREKKARQDLIKEIEEWEGLRERDIETPDQHLSEWDESHNTLAKALKAELNRLKLD